MTIVLLIIGIILVLKGADWLTDGAVGIATKFGVPQIVIGLTIVAMGTSMPEFCVSLISALKGTPDLAVGNIVGSNIFNALCIVGIAAMVAPITILRSTVKKDIPFAILASVALLLMCLDKSIGRIDAVILCILFVVFMYMTLKGARQGGEEESDEPKKTLTWFRSSLLIIVGLVALIFGSNLFVDSASAIARSLGVSDAVIGLTIVAMGTSLPELATSVVAAHRGNSGIAIGNVVGSNVFNILFILGVTGLIQPMHMQGITMLDLGVMVGAMILLWLFSRTKYLIQRWEGALLTAVFIAYMAILLT